jgi:hypothetical protein
MPPLPVAYKTGAAKADITDSRRGLVFAGYSYEEQESSGTVDVPLFARAFVIEESAGANRLCLVVIDAWACPEPIKTRVLEKLPAALRAKFNRSNLVISATHTHSAPGGYADYFLYNLTTGGHDKILLTKIVTGIVTAIKTAYANLKPGKVFVAQGDLAGCGDNRSVKAYRATPEGQQADAYDKRTDREMTALRFTQLTDAGETEIGLYSIFAIHPTSIGMFNVDISGDNKGWAAQVCEMAKGGSYVAAFANANAGDVSPNVTVRPDWSSSITRPEGRPGTAETQADKARMKANGQMQADKALALVSGPMTELTGPLRSRSTHVDMSNVRIAPGKRTFKAALGASFAAGSKEDSIGILTMFGIVDFRPDINEGVNLGAYAAGYARTVQVVGQPDAEKLRDLQEAWKLTVLALKWLANGEFDALKADALAHSWAYPRAAQVLFPDRVEDLNPTFPTGATWKWEVPHSNNWPAAYVAGHGEKPIMFAVGITQLKKNGRTPFLDQPLVPHVVQLQAVQIGGLVLGALPNELTTVAGRRMKGMLRNVFGTVTSHVALVAYANDYAFYITTKEEYDQQQYEGASTLYGPHTLDAYLQEMSKVATALRNTTALAVGTPVVPKAIYLKR